jgi:pimeloyl-ACP methyl ester carboxylesterase
MTVAGDGCVFVLVHSLLLGPLSWAPVAHRLAPRAVVPSLVDVGDAGPPFWRSVAETVRDAVDELPVDRPVVIVAHSNAGLFVPVIVEACPRRVAGCLFVDAALPSPSGSTPTASPERLAFLRSMAVDGWLPRWTDWWGDSEVASLFPDEPTRRAVSAEQPRLPLTYYEAAVPTPAGWDDRPCGYLQFSPAYADKASEAERRGWAVDHVPGQHLHQLVDPETVTGRIVALTGR